MGNLPERNLSVVWRPGSFSCGCFVSRRRQHPGRQPEEPLSGSPAGGTSQNCPRRGQPRRRPKGRKCPQNRFWRRKARSWGPLAPRSPLPGHFGRPDPSRRQRPAYCRSTSLAGPPGCRRPRAGLAYAPEGRFQTPAEMARALWSACRSPRLPEIQHLAATVVCGKPRYTVWLVGTLYQLGQKCKRRRYSLPTPSTQEARAPPLGRSQLGLPRPGRRFFTPSAATRASFPKAAYSLDGGCPGCLVFLERVEAI